MATAPSAQQVVDDTRRWLERAVIGLNLCPFAKAVHLKGLVHFAIASGPEFATVLDDLDTEVAALLARTPEERETTLLIVPAGFEEFLLFNDLVRKAERRVSGQHLDGIIQLASFHPQYLFAGSDAGDMANCSNRSPYPTLHLLREESIDRAVAAFPQAEAIYGANMEALRQLGPAAWDALGVGRK